MVEVRLLDKTKLRGRMGQVTDQGFVIQQLVGGTSPERNVAFTEVNSVKIAKKRNPGVTAAKIGLGVAAGVGVVLILLAILITD